MLITVIWHIFIAQLIGFGSGLKTETGKIYKYTSEGETSHRGRPESYSVFGFGRENATQTQEYHSHVSYLFLESELLALLSIN